MAKKKKPASRKGPATARKKLSAMARAELRLRHVEMVRDLRQHYRGYEARDGYPLKPAAIDKLPWRKRHALEEKHAGLQRILSTPRVAVKAHDKAEAKVLRRETGQRRRGQKHFLVSVPDAERSKVEVLAGEVKITTKLPGRAEVEEMFFHFPRKPKTPADLVRMLQEMLPGMPKDGTYFIVTTAGEFTYTVDHGQLESELRETLDTYDNEKYGAHRYLFQVLGFRWVRNKKDAKIIRTRRSAARAARRQANREAAQRLKERAAKSGKKKS